MKIENYQSILTLKRRAHFIICGQRCFGVFHAMFFLLREENIWVLLEFKSNKSVTESNDPH